MKKKTLPANTAICELFKLTAVIFTLGLAGCAQKSALDPQHFPHILLIVLDAARADHFSSYGYRRQTTPAMDRVAGEGARFSRAVSTSSWTLPAHASLFTGLLPEEHGARNQHAWLIDRIPTLAELLKTRGYRTGCFTNNPIIDQQHNLVRGFERVERIWADSAVVTGDRPHNSEHTNRLVRSFVGEGGGRPFFVFINYMDVHQPYDAPQPFRGMYLEPGQEITARLDSACRYAGLLDDGSITLSEPEKEALGAIYDGCLTYLDRQVEELLRSLREAGLYDSTLIIITSDHGESFGEKGKYGHGDLLDRPLIQIPLLIRYPALFPAPVVRDDLVSIADIFHSLVARLGLEGAGESGLPARDLFAGKIEEGPCYSSFVLGRAPKERMKYHHDSYSVWTPDNLHYLVRGAEATECFDLGADFGERHNLCPAKFSREAVESAVAAVRERLIAFSEDAPDLRITAELKIDPQQERALRALGYVGGGPADADLSSLPHLQEHPHFLEHFQTGNFFFALDSLTGAGVELGRALKMSPQNERLRIKLGYVQYRNGRFQEAAGTLHPLIGKTEYDKEVSLILGPVFKALGKRERALEYFVKAAELEPAPLEAAMNAAELLIGLRRFSEARPYVDRILAQRFGNLPVLLQIISFYLNNENQAEARDLLLDLLKKAQSGTVYALLALVYEEMGQKDEADNCRKKAASLGMSGSRLSQLEKSLNEVRIQLAAN